MKMFTVESDITDQQLTNFCIKNINAAQFVLPHLRGASAVQARLSPQGAERVLWGFSPIAAASQVKQLIPHCLYLRGVRGRRLWNTEHWIPSSFG